MSPGPYSREQSRSRCRSKLSEFGRTDGALSQDIIIAQAYRQGESHQRGGRHERKPGLHRRKAGGRRFASPQRIFARCHLRNYANQLMLEVKEFDQDPSFRQPDTGQVGRLQTRSMPLPDSCWARSRECLATVSDGARDDAHCDSDHHVRLHRRGIRQFAPMFNQLGLTVAQGGAGGKLDSSKPAAGLGQLLCSPARALRLFWFRAT